MLLLPGSLHAQRQLPDSARQTRFITRALTYGVGYSNIYDTYLSPQEYNGIDFRIARESMRMTRWADGRLSLQNYLQGDFAYTHNKVDNNNTLYGLVNWNYGLHYHFPLAHNFRLLAGGLADLNGGFVYNLRNSNNPASARAYINLDASVMAIMPAATPPAAPLPGIEATSLPQWACSTEAKCLNPSSSRPAICASAPFCRANTKAAPCGP